MKIETSKLKEVCSKIIVAKDTTSLASVSNTLEIDLKDKKLSLNMTNLEYYVSVSVDVENEETFNCQVDSTLFLNLVSKLTTKDIELTKTNENYLELKANGVYKIPFIYDNLENNTLPKIELVNVVEETSVSADKLLDILNYNKKETLKASITKEAQKVYSLDNKGCLTFSSGACINNFEFNLTKQILLTTQIVNLFKVFNPTDEIKIKYSSEFVNDIEVSKIEFSSKDTFIRAFTRNDEQLFKSFPCNAIRKLGNTDFYENKITLNKVQLLDAINRLLLFYTNTAMMSVGVFNILENQLILTDASEDNKENIEIDNAVPCKFMISLVDLKNVIDKSSGEFLTLHYSTSETSKSIAISQENIVNVIPLTTH